MNGREAGRIPDRHPSQARLSPRETHVLNEVARGLPNKQIALRLGISEKTVRNHLSHVFEKLQASNRTQAVMNAIHRGLPVAWRPKNSA